MILHDIISRANREMRNNPGIQVDEDDKVALVNELMLSVLGDEQWRFLMRRPEITIYADYAGVVATQRATFSNASLVVTATGGDTTVFLEWMEGQKITGPDEAVYRIAGVNLTNGLTLYLDRPYEGANTTNSPSWTIEHDRLRLPRDCIEYYGMVDRTGRRRVHTISAREDEAVQLSRTAGGDITTVMDELAEHYEPVETVLTATVDGGGANNLPASTQYEYCQTIEEFGRESHGTRVVSATTAAATTLNILIGGVIKGLGQRARIYRRDVTNRGGWYLRWTAEPGVILSAINDSSLITDTSTKLQQDGPTEYLRIYRKPDTDTALELRYLAKPRRMISANDAPQMPEQYHEILWRMLVGELHARKGAMDIAKYHRGIAEGRVTSMRQKYLERADRTFIMGKMPLGGSRWETRYGDPSKT